MSDLKAVGNIPGLGALFAVKIAKAAYHNLEGRTKATGDKDKGPLHKDIPYWDIRGTDKASGFVIIFTTDPWWMKTEYAGLCEVAGLRDKTVNDRED